MDYSRALRVVRAARGYSQTKLAEKSGFSSAYVSKLEDGKRVATEKALERLTPALGVPRELLDLLAAEPARIKHLEADKAQQLALDLLQILVEAEA